MSLLILFIIVILLCLVFRLVLKYIRLRRSLKRYELDLQTQIARLSSRQKAEHEILGMETELHSIIDMRLTELDLKFPDKNRDLGSVSPEVDRFSHSLKRMLQSTLALFKIEHS